MTEDKLKAEIYSLIGRYTDRDPSRIAPSDHLVFDLGLDGDDFSFDMVAEIERRFDLLATDDEWSEVETVADLEQLVRRLAGRHRPEVSAKRASQDQSIRKRIRWVLVGFAGLFAGLIVLTLTHRLVAAAFVWLVAVVSGIIYARQAYLGWRERRRWRGRRQSERTQGA